MDLLYISSAMDDKRDHVCHELGSMLGTERRTFWVSNLLNTEQRKTQHMRVALRWRQNERDAALNHQPHDCLLNHLFRHRSKKTAKLRVTGLCAGDSPMTGEFPAQRTRNAKNVSIWWRHHVGTDSRGPFMRTWRSNHVRFFFFTQPLTHLLPDKMAPISQTTLSDVFCEKKVWYFNWNFTEVCS